MRHPPRSILSRTRFSILLDIQTIEDTVGRQGWNSTEGAGGAPRSASTVPHKGRHVKRFEFRLFGAPLLPRTVLVGAQGFEEAPNGRILRSQGRHCLAILGNGCACRDGLKRRSGLER